MKLPLINILSKATMLGLVAVAITFGACTPEDDDFNVFTPVDFIITADARTIEAGNSITFNDESIGATGREWSFEGGMPATSTDMNPTVNYAVAGTYFTNVTTSFSDGRQETRRLRIIVVPLVVPNFSASPSALQVGGDVQFNNLTSGVGAIPDVYEATDTNVVFQWVFEGGTPATSSANKPIVRYDELGNFDVTLTVTRLSTNSMETITKTDIITVLSVPVTQARAVDFDRDGSNVLVTLSEEVGVLPADAASKFTLTASGGGTVAITGIEIADYGSNVIKLNVDSGTLTAGEIYTLSFSEVGSISAASGSALLDFSKSMTFLGTSQSWAQNNFTENGTVTTMLGGKSFDFTTSGLTFNTAQDASLTVFHTEVMGFFINIHTAASPYTMTITPGNDAALSDIGDVALEMGLLAPTGSEYVFSQPITDVRFNNTFSNDAPGTVASATLSDDGTVLTITNQFNRNHAVKISALVEGTISAGGLTISHNAPAGCSIHVTASGR